MRNIIYEYEEVSNNDLKSHIINTSELHKYFKQDWGKVKAKQYCGILNYDNTDYYILPKITDSETTNLNIFIYMLMYAYDVKLSNEQIASCANQEKHTILEVFVHMFAQNLINELKKGIYKEYITQQDNLPVLKGKYLINENLKYNFTKNKIYCEYDEFSANNNLNQFFLYAVKYLQKFVKDKKLLKQCELIFDEVEYKSVDINKLDMVHFNRLNQRFKISYEIAILLLKQSIPLFRQDKKSFAFLFDMNMLFENFIARIVKENYDDVKIPKSYTSFGGLNLKPDIIVISKNLIIDCKYKIIEKNEIAKRDDRYQMYAYGNNFKNIYTTILLYPKHLDDIDEIITLGDNDKKVELKMKSVDLNFYGNDYEKYLEEIKDRMELINEK